MDAVALEPVGIFAKPFEQEGYEGTGTGLGNPTEDRRKLATVWY